MILSAAAPGTPPEMSMLRFSAGGDVDVVGKVMVSDTSNVEYLESS